MILRLLSLAQIRAACFVDWVSGDAIQCVSAVKMSAVLIGCITVVTWQYVIIIICIAIMRLSICHHSLVYQQNFEIISSLERI